MAAPREPRHLAAAAHIRYGVKGSPRARASFASSLLQRAVCAVSVVPFLLLSRLRRADGQAGREPSLKKGEFRMRADNGGVDTWLADGDGGVGVLGVTTGRCPSDLLCPVLE